MRVLGIETSTNWCSVALGDGRSWCERHVDAGHTHSELLLPQIESVLAEAGIPLTGLDAIAFGAGPGSFTGLRIACAVAQGLAWGADLPVAAVCSLEALAHGAGRDRVAIAVDARMRQIYCAAYVRAGTVLNEAVAPVAVDPHAVPALPPGRWFGAGSGFAAHPEICAAFGVAAGDCDPVATPNARAVAELGLLAIGRGEAVTPDEARPIYVRNRVALTAAERAAGERL